MTWSGTLDGPLRLVSVAVAVADHLDRDRAEPDRARDDAGHAHRDRHRACRHPDDDAGEWSRSLNFLYSGADMWFQNSVHVKAPVYVTRDLHLRITAVIDGSACDGLECRTRLRSAVTST